MSRFPSFELELTVRAVAEAEQTSNITKQPIDTEPEEGMSLRAIAYRRPIQEHVVLKLLAGVCVIE